LVMFYYLLLFYFTYKYDVREVQVCSSEESYFKPCFSLSPCDYSLTQQLSKSLPLHSHHIFFDELQTLFLFELSSPSMVAVEPFGPTYLVHKIRRAKRMSQVYYDGGRRHDSINLAFCQ